MKKGVISFIIILILSAVVFFIGWIQFAVPAGMYGVLVSKTGGVNSETIVPGEFRWQWEKLLPTNVRILTFSLAPQSFEFPVTGSFPSAEVYSAFMNGKPDFSYDIKVNVQASIRYEALPTLVKTHSIETQEQLNEYLTQQAHKAAQAAAEYILTSYIENPVGQITLTYDTDSYLAAISADERFPNVTFGLLTADIYRMPDVALYNAAKDFYLTYYEHTKKALITEAERQAQTSASDYLEMERFSRWGKVLTEYPILIDFLAVTGSDPAQASAALESVKKSSAD